MSSNIYVISSKRNNIKAKYNGEKIEIAKAPFQTKVLWNEAIPEKLIKVASNNKAEYFLELLDLRNSVEKELVFIRKENQNSSSEGMDRHQEAIGYLIKGEIVPSIETLVQKGSVGKKDYNKSIEWFNGAVQFYMNDELVYERGDIPEVSKD